jgi:hypothetical protein
MPQHGGQTEIAYHGGSNPNATASGGEVSEEGRTDAPAPAREPHTLQQGHRTIEVIEQSGIAAAEATGKVAPNDPSKREATPSVRRCPGLIDPLSASIDVVPGPCNRLSATKVVG